MYQLPNKFLRDPDYKIKAKGYILYLANTVAEIFGREFRRLIMFMTMFLQFSVVAL